MNKRLAKKVLLIGWDAADWKVINPLLDSGQMPALERLVNGGTIGKIATLDPPLSPMLWTSIGTGKRPYKHGVLGFTEPKPDMSGIQPVLSSSRKVKAIWNILSERAFKTHLVGWWPSHPAENINGISISNFYQKDSDAKDGVWKMAEGAVAPEDRASFFEKLRVHPREITQEHILPFVQQAAKVDQSNDRNLYKISKFIAHSASIQAAATYILEHEEWDFMGVYFDAIDHFCHQFMKYHPPKLDKVSDEEFETYHGVVAAAYKFHDMLLDRLIHLAGPDTTVMLVSDHGFHSDHLRPKKLPAEPAAPAFEHSPFGIFCLGGPHIKKDERIYGASILDVTPTVLSLFGLPMAKDMDGKVLVNAFENVTPLDVIETYEEDHGLRYEPDIADHSNIDEEVLQQLVDLGYIEKPPSDLGKAVKQVMNDNSYYLARSFIDGKKYHEAIQILKKLHKDNPDNPTFAVRLAASYLALNKIPAAKAILNNQKNHKSLSQKVLEGTLLLQEGNHKAAKTAFEEAEKEGGQIPNLYLQIGRNYLKLKQISKAKAAFKKELEINPESAGAFYGKGICYLKEQNYEEAADNFISAIGLIYNFPLAHHNLGEALYALGHYEHAANAFQVALTINPKLNKSREYLATIYENHLKNPEKAATYKNAIAESASGEIIIVSGLPRSGTSMMMQMLYNGGLPIFTDNTRKPDENNPRGYYEHEAVKNLQYNKKWLKGAVGKGVKVISHLLPHLPGRFRYKVVFMQRDLYEVMNSQEKMLIKTGKLKQPRNVVSLTVLEEYKRNLAQIEKWAEEKPNVEIVTIAFQDVIRDPFSAAEKVRSFLKIDLDLGKMAQAVDKSLYRENLNS